MADEMQMAHAKEVFDNLCTALDNRQWHYNKHEEDLVITFGATGEDLPMDFILIVDANRQLLRLLSKLPFVVPEDKRMELAIATCVATNKILDGSFDFDLKDGTIFFRLTESFRSSEIGEGLFNYMIGVSCTTVDRYNDKFFAVSKGLMSLQDFIQATE